MARPRKPTVADAIEFWKRSRLRHGPIGKTNTYFAENFLKRMGDKKVLELSGADLLRYVDRGQGAPAQRREINTVKGIVNYYRKMVAGEQPIYLDRPRDNPGRERWLTAEERDEFLALTPDELRPLATALFFTGGRRSELQKLTTADVDYKRRTLRLFSSKGGKRGDRVIPIHDRLWPFIEPTQSNPPKQRVFLQADGRPWNDQYLYRLWWPTVLAMGITNFKPHDARHSFGSELVRQGVSLRVVADLLGHSSLTMVMRYAHVAGVDSQDAVLRL